MPQFEYKVDSLTPDYYGRNLQDSLNAYGDLEWELIYIGFDPGGTRLVFKRPICQKELTEKE